MEHPGAAPRLSAQLLPQFWPIVGPWRRLVVGVMVMGDPNLRDFHSRVARIEQTHATGGGFEAKGTLGRASFQRRPRRRLGFLFPFLIFLICGIGIKAAIHYQVGTEVYQARIERLLSGQGFSRLGGVVMQSDPLSRFIADQLARLPG